MIAYTATSWVPLNNKTPMVRSSRFFPRRNGSEALGRSPDDRHDEGL